MKRGGVSIRDKQPPDLSGTEATALAAADMNLGMSPAASKIPTVTEETSGISNVKPAMASILKHPHFIKA